MQRYTAIIRLAMHLCTLQSEPRTRTEEKQMHIQPNQTLIVGGTGKTGRRVTQRFQARGLPVRVAARSVAPGFDWADPSSWPALLSQVHAVYLAYHPDLALPE